MSGRPVFRPKLIPSSDQKKALDAANSPNASNPFATIADVGTGGGGGSKGDTGTPGVAGIKGDTGSSSGGGGLQGDTGTVGAKGDTGTGIQGDSGIAGVQGDTGTPGTLGDKGDTGTGVKGDTGSGSAVAALDDLTDVVAPSPTRDQVLKFNGTDWVPAAYNATFQFSLAGFADNQADAQLIGAGLWKAVGALGFTASYNNGPPDSASIALSSDGAVSWVSMLVLATPFTSVVSSEGTNYPNAKDRYVRFTLSAIQGSDSPTAISTVTFRNNIKYGQSNKASGWDSVDINALSGTLLSNVQTGSFAVNAAAGEYIIFAFPSSYTSINVLGFLFNSIACPFEAFATVSVTNSAGYTENYKVYRSTLTALGSASLVTSTSANTIDPIYWGVTSKSGTFLESDVEGLTNSAISNTKGRTFSLTGSATEYVLYALPARLGAVVFWVGGFEGGFMPFETVSITNTNGYTENYYVYRSANFVNGSVTVTTV